jgi:hypothetical protein
MLTMKGGNRRNTRSEKAYYRAASFTGTAYRRKSVIKRILYTLQQKTNLSSPTQSTTISKISMTSSFRSILFAFVLIHLSLMLFSARFSI